MTTYQANNETIHINDKFGLITDNQLIITKGSKKSKVPFDSINRVNLIKRRVFYLNTILLLLSISVFIYSFFVLKSEKLFLFYGLLFIGIALFIFSIVHKFYIYKLIIKEKDKTLIEIKTTQINRKSIKEFYNAIVQKVPKK
jgi:heme/copper-type cytochrome/quinol oxidase subunit 3